MNTITVSRISTDTIIAMHNELIAQMGGIDDIRDRRLIDMSVNSPFQTFEGDLYPSLEAKAANLFYSLTKNHPFLDGNKRIGVTAMLVFLKANGIDIDCSNDELAALGIGVADSTCNEDDITAWIKKQNIT